MEKSKIKPLAIIFFCGYLLASCFANTVKAEDVVTGNILPNAGNSVSSYNSGTAPVISDNTSNTTMSNNTTLDGFAITCDTANGQNGGCGAFFAYDKAVEAAHDLKITSSATLVGIAGTGQTSSDTITSTAAKLDKGITLNSTIDMQNCEWSGSAFACGDSTGAADSYTVRVRILDSSDEELAAVTQTRTTDAGYYANSKTFTNQLIYTGIGASKFLKSVNWIDIDSNLPCISVTNSSGNGSVVKNMPASAGDVDSIPRSGRSPGEENGSPLQYSCLEIPMKPSGLQFMGSQKSQTRLSD